MTRLMATFEESRKNEHPILVKVLTLCKIYLPSGNAATPFAMI
jgi:hypothetical protein